MRVDDILNRKGSDVATVRAEASVLDAACRMNHRRIGSLVVVGDDGGIAGIISERDILTRVVAQERDPAGTCVRQVMTAPVVTCSRWTTLDELRSTMHSRRIRHIPVVDEIRGLCGLISLGDLNAAHARELEDTITVLETFVRM